MLLGCALLACGGGGGDGKGPAPLPTPTPPAAGTIGDGRLNEILEWARASQNAPAMATVVIRRGQVVEKAAVGLRSADASVRVTGTYNGVDFVYTGRFDSEQEFDLNPPLVANETGGTNLTLFVDLDKWFRDSSGGLIDPATANAGQPNQGVVEQNIKSALDAFEDENHDGRDDGPSHQ